VVAHTIDLDVDDAELERRRGVLKHPEPRYTTGVLAKFARLVTGAERGAITEAWAAPPPPRRPPDSGADDGHDEGGRRCPTERPVEGGVAEGE
jgi:hypothetical protein